MEQRNHQTRKGNRGMSGDNELVMMYNREYLESKCQQAWEEGYKAGWQDNELDFEEHHIENPWKGEDQ